MIVEASQQTNSDRLRDQLYELSALRNTFYPEYK